MPVPHVFLNKPRGSFDGDQRFWTTDTILHSDAYTPEVLFVGTFNPDVGNDNPADFFYGRNHFWPALVNLFKEGRVVHTDRRIRKRGMPQPPEERVPTLRGVLDLCVQLKLGFADLVREVFHDTRGETVRHENGYFIFRGKRFDLIQDGELDKKTGHYGLQGLNKEGQVLWNTVAIEQYLQRTPSIKAVYLTRGYQTPWVKPWSQLKKWASSNHAPILFERIYTPSLRGSGDVQDMKGLLHHWLHHRSADKQGYGHLDHQWLRGHGVDISRF